MQKQSLHVIHIAEETVSRIWEEWHTHTKKGTSFVDCANLVVAREMNANIASFDHFYPKKMRIS